MLGDLFHRKERFLKEQRIELGKKSQLPQVIPILRTIQEERERTEK